VASVCQQTSAAATHHRSVTGRHQCKKVVTQSHTDSIINLYTFYTATLVDGRLVISIDHCSLIMKTVENSTNTSGKINDKKMSKIVST